MHDKLKQKLHDFIVSLLNITGTSPAEIRIIVEKAIEEHKKQNRSKFHYDV